MSIGSKQLKRWQIVDRRYLLENRWLKVRQDTIRLPSGSVIDDYFVTEGHNAASVFAVTKDNRVIINRQYKHGAGDLVYELPAGIIEANESALSAAQRELLEETGFIAKRWRKMGEWYVGPTTTPNKKVLFLAEGAAKVQSPIGDEREEIEVHFVPIDELLGWVRGGRIKCLKSVAAIYWCLDKLGRQ